MKFFPSSALDQLEFKKVRELLVAHCKTELGKERADGLRIHTKKEFIEIDLQQTHEYKTLLLSTQYFPADYTQNIFKELKLLGIPGATLTGAQFLDIKKLAIQMAALFRWFKPEWMVQYQGLYKILQPSYYEKEIVKAIDEILDDSGQVKDTASKTLADIRLNLFRKRSEIRKVFNRIVSKLNKLGYLADIEESYMNGRRVLAVFAEQKRMVKGILHNESDSRRTSFIEPEETTELNNAIFSLELEEQKEVNRILALLTQKLSVFAPLLKQYFEIIGLYDFIKAKALLAIDMQANYPMLIDKPHIQLINAYHPLLYLYHKKIDKTTVPVNLQLNEENRILVISGPNAGGKTVTLKTVGLLQVMLQSGLLIPVHPDSKIGIFKQLFLHIGDTQSLEFELSTYSAHLKNMKHFLENANGKTLFFIDELGSGSDPNLGGAFAEVIMEELAFKHSFGIVTTHYLNLKVMANKVKGIINGAMQFDENKLLPLYKLQIGQPGSSYTFAIAERIGLNKKLISKARKLVDDEQFNLDHLLNKTEQDLQEIHSEKIKLDKLLKENEQLKKELNKALQKELHLQEVEKLRLQNQVSTEKLVYLKDMERKLKAMIIEWKKTPDKQPVINMMQALLFNQKEKIKQDKQQKKLSEKYLQVAGHIEIGDKVQMKQNRQVGTVLQLKNKTALLQVGNLPMTVAIENLIKIIDKPQSDV